VRSLPEGETQENTRRSKFDPGGVLAKRRVRWQELISTLESPKPYSIQALLPTHHKSIDAFQNYGLIQTEDRT
jgi:hypothetical protein